MPHRPPLGLLAELAMKRTQRAVDLVAEAIRRARSREPREDIGGSRWQAGTAEVRAWALSAGYEIPEDGVLPEMASAAGPGLVAGSLAVGEGTA
jgi:hypothetical protein